jgi:ELWxxDGT repeat protein
MVHPRSAPLLTVVLALTLAGADLAGATAPGTALRIDPVIWSFGGGYGPLATTFVAVGGQVLCSAADATHGGELWSIDADAHAHLVKDIWPGDSGSAPTYLTALGDQLFFAAGSGTTPQLWRSDGTAAGTVLVTATPMMPQDLVAFGGALYFCATLAASDSELWRSDGTAAGTAQFKNLRATGSSQPSDFFVCGAKLFFTAAITGDADRELCVSDGTVAGTALVKDIRPGPFSSDPRGMVAMGGRLYFTAISGSSDTELWTSDGTAAGTTRMLEPWPAGLSVRTPPAVLGSTLVFGAADSAHGWELWRSDGTVAGTAMVADMRPGTDSFLVLDKQPVVMGGVAYFPADDGVHGAELWRSDGTAAGTWMVKDIQPGAVASYPDCFCVVGDRIFFSADDGAHGKELWTSDGTSDGTVLAADTVPGGAGSELIRLTNADGQLYWIELNGQNGLTDRYELWTYRMNGAGTTTGGTTSGGTTSGLTTSGTTTSGLTTTGTSSGGGSTTSGSGGGGGGGSGHCGFSAGLAVIAACASFLRLRRRDRR